MEQDQPQFAGSFNSPTSSEKSKRSNANSPSNTRTNNPLPVSQQQVPQLPSQRHLVARNTISGAGAGGAIQTNRVTNTHHFRNYPQLITNSPNRMSYPMFSPQPGPSSPFGGGGASGTGGGPQAGNSPPTKRIRGDTANSPSSPNLNFLLPTQRHTPGSIEQNVSYTRSYSSTSLSGAGKISNLRGSSSHVSPQPLQALTPGPHEGSSTSQQPQQQRQRQENQLTELRSLDSDEDARFLRLAREALVATASGVNPGSTLVDPTIQDLLQRLQYASSPHGNPIKRGNKITANQKGQLNISGFYRQFPNLSNDIFMGNEGGIEGNAAEENVHKSHHPSSNSEGWNFLIGEPITYKTPGVLYNKEENKPNDSIDILRSHSTTSLSDEGYVGGSSRKNSAVAGEDPSRKFLCGKCSMSFRRSSDLKRHEKQHLTIPPNICELCGKGFARKDALKRHMGTLTCKRNADKKLYIENLNYLKEQKAAGLGSRSGTAAGTFASGFSSASNFDRYHLDEDDDE